MRQDRYKGKLKSNAQRILNERSNDIRAVTQGLAKVPPHAREVEEAVLGAMMIEKDAYKQVSLIISAYHFYDDRNVRIYEAMKRLSNAMAPIDLITLSSELRNTAELEIIGGLPYLVELTNRVNTAANIEYHARIIVEHAMKRALIGIGSMIEREAFEDNSDPFVIIKEVYSMMNKIVDFRGSKKPRTLAQIQQSWVENVEKAKKSKDGMLGIPYGFKEIDLYTSGKVAAEFTVIAARPGMGKTLFLLQCVKNAVKRFVKKVAVFQLEMIGEQLYGRYVASEVQIANSEIRRGNISDEQWHSIFINEFLKSDNVLIDDYTDTDAETLMLKASKMVLEEGVQEIWIDYLQLVDGDDNSGTREQVISKISRTCKKISKELNIPVIALSQLSRAVENRPDKRPQLSDLRESGAIEQDADVVIFLWRPEYYNIFQDDKGNSLVNKLCVIIAKNRAGALGDIWLDCFLSKSTIVDPGTLDIDHVVITNELPKGTNGLKAFENEETPF